MTQVVVGAKKTKALQRELGLPPLPSLFYSLPSPNTDSVNATNTKENPWYHSRLSLDFTLSADLFTELFGESAVES